MHIPSSTYRVQLHKGFTFKDLDNILEYLKQLGISTIYAAPILHATPGSMHGYDVIDPHQINPEIGTLEELKILSKRVKALDMYWLQDIVPNHMAFNTNNTRLMDVLERGPASPYYDYFDINWDHPSTVLKGKLCVPFLGKEIDQCIAAKEIKLSFSEKGFSIAYFDTHYPLSISAISYLQQFANSTLRDAFVVFEDKAKTLRHLDEWHAFKEIWIKRISSSEIESLVIKANDPEKIKALLQKQFYSLTFWQRADQEINYRRFFTVNELICLRMEDDEVFREYHSFLHALCIEGIIQGLRIDHIDGLKEPRAYIQKLRKMFGEDMYIIAEKILEAKEDVPKDWALQGTSGYEFLAYINQLTTDKKGAKQLLKFYRSLITEQEPYKELVLRNKKLILENHMGGEWDNLLSYMIELKLQNTFELLRLKKALAAFMISLPVYRLYPEQLPLSGKDLVIIKEAFDKALLIDPSCKTELEYLCDLFTKEGDVKKTNALNFLKRLMQFTGPLTAKGVEDTTFYLYNPLISHDEVGDAPSTLGISIQAFNAKMSNRLQTSALSLNATNTHDTKRGEDARIRLNVISEFPDQWETLVRKWLDINKAHRQDKDGKRIPSLNDEYFIYQAIAGSFPEDLKVNEEWIDRLKAYQTKAMREAKLHSNWTTPDELYEPGCHAFAEAILTPGSEFLLSFVPFIKEICKHAAIHSLAQVVLKCTAPGIPDIYQGCELFDLSFVDPDNRRPVDYGKRKTCLHLIEEQEKENHEHLFHFLEVSRQEGYEKFFITWKLLNFRRENNALFISGNYQPLQVAGGENNVMAYARQLDNEWVIIVLSTTASKNIFSDDNFVMLPENAPTEWSNIFNSIVHTTHSRKLTLENVLDNLSVAVLQSAGA
jgi:(1->4)-alpha-D-glucan 1-alpha-D-glucosylmutase